MGVQILGILSVNTCSFYHLQSLGKLDTLVVYSISETFELGVGSPEGVVCGSWYSE